MPNRFALLARACALLVLATLVAATPAHASFSMGKLHYGAVAGPENYVTTAGDKLYPEGTVDTGLWHRFVVTDPTGVVRAQTACTANPASGSVTGETSYTVPPSAAATTTTGWRYQLQQFPTSACSGAPATKQLYFTVARLTAYTSSALTTATTAIAPGSSAYIRIAGLGKLKGAPTVAADVDWSTTWLKPDASTSCANTAGKGERAPSAANGTFPTVAGDFLQYRPNTTSTGDLWNQEPLYETKPCASTATHGQWKLKVLKDPSHFVTLNAFLVTPLTATTISSAPATPGGDRHPAWSFSGGGGVGHECRLRQDADVVYDWAPCLSPVSYDLTGLPEGEYEFSVHSVAGADVGPDAVAAYLLDTTPPATPSI